MLDLTGFTELMVLIMETNKNPENINKITNILINNPEEIDKQHNNGSTALMFASKYSNTEST